MVTVHLLRHAESTFNADETCTDHDAGLTPFGALQASRVCDEDTDTRWDIIFVSPLRRCRETLANSRVTHTVVVVDVRLREWRQDPCDFMTHELVELETEDELLDRVRAMLLVCSGQPQGSRVLLVTHGDWITYFLLLAGVETDAYPLNAELVKVSLQQ